MALRGCGHQPRGDPATLNARYGSDISGFAWLTVVQTVAALLDQSEDYYERGAGGAQVPTPDGRAFYHNVAVAGYTVADAWLVTPVVPTDLQASR